MNADYIYDIFETTRLKDAPDLYIGLAMLKVDQPISDEEDKEIRLFIGRHYTALADAYKLRDRDTFAAVVAQCEAEDKEDAENDGDATEGEAE